MLSVRHLSRFAISLISTCALLLVAFGASLMLSSEQAYAKFNEVADSYPAAQDLGSYGRAIKGGDLPDGSYKVTARTTSRMCIMYTDPADAEARDSKEQAIILVEGGQMTAVFYISKAYTHLYEGTAEQAAKQTDKDGADASAYIAGDPDEGYVPHMFALPISALNKPMTLSAYSGGDKGLENGKWYTREVVFKMTEAELEAAIAAANPEPEPSSSSSSTPDPEPEPSSSSSSTIDPDPEPGSSSSSSTDSDPDPESSSSSSTDSDPEPESSSSSSSTEDEDEKDDKRNREKESQNEPQPVLTADNVTGGGSGDGSGEGGGQGGGSDAQQNQPGSEEGGESGARATSASSGPTTMRGVRMTIAGSDLVIDTSGIERPEQKEIEGEEFMLTPEQILALIVLAAFVLGVALRGVTYANGFDRSRDDRPVPPKPRLSKGAA